MPTADEIKTAIATSATGPAKVTGDEGSVEQHPLPDQIAAEKHIRGNDAVATPRRGLRYSKFVPPGAC